MIATIAVVGAFNDLAALSNAYGFSVATVFFVTTVFITIHIVQVKKLPFVVGLGYFIVWGFIDGSSLLWGSGLPRCSCSRVAAFWGACLKKVPHGAWVPLMLGGILYVQVFPSLFSPSHSLLRRIAIMLVWSWGKVRAT